VTVGGGVTDLEHMLDARDLHRSFGDVRAVDGVTFEVGSSELYGLIGPDGAGKTTTLRLVTGLLAPDEGEVRVAGQVVEAGAREVREKIGYMPQQYSLYGDLSVDENLEFFGRLFGLDAAARRERRDRLLAITRLQAFGDRRAEQLSGGMYKKLALACALLHQPGLLVLDEPSNGVDPVSRRELWDLLYEFVEEGMAVVLATPNMDEAARCHRVGMLHDGRFLAEGTPAALVEEFPHHAYAIESSQRDETEEVLFRRDDVLALSPEAHGLRVVVRESAAAGFERWADADDAITRIEPIDPTFEDVFLGLLATREEHAGGDDDE